MKPPILIAEIGCVHIGQLDRAIMLADLAKESGADVLKLQKRNPYESLSGKQQKQPHPNERFAYGKTYLEHRLNLELDIEKHKILKYHCEDIGITYSSSVWDITSTKEICGLMPKAIKIPSACNHKFDLIDYIYNNSMSDIHISLGMTTKEERDRLVSHLLGNIDHRRFVLYHCTSAYPCPFEKLYLKEIEELAQLPFAIGFSNHGYGIAADIAAMAMGVEYIERHFVDDRTFPHTDSSASLEPSGLKKLKRDLEHISTAIEYKPNDIDELEKEQRDKLRT